MENKIKRIEELLARAKAAKQKAFRFASHTEYLCFERAVESLEAAIRILKEPSNKPVEHEQAGVR